MGGYTRYASYTEANRLAADFNSLASAGATFIVGIFTLGNPIAIAIPGVPSSYWWHLASRIDSHNSAGRGVIVHMTWALVFNVEAQ